MEWLDPQTDFRFGFTGLNFTSDVLKKFPTVLSTKTKNYCTKSTIVD